MKKQILFATLSIAATSTFAITDSAFEQAKKNVIRYAQDVSTKYAQSCPNIAGFYQFVCSSKYPEAWSIIKTIITELEKLDVYKSAIQNPNDDIFWAELSLIASVVSNQVMFQKMQSNDEKSMEMGAQIGCSVGLYIELLRKDLKK